MRAPLVVVSGPSGVGKSTVVQAVLQQSPDVWLSVSATTRAARPGEVNGEHYFFLSQAEFDELVTRGEPLEIAMAPLVSQSKSVGPKAFPWS